MMSIVNMMRDLVPISPRKQCNRKTKTKCISLSQHFTNQTKIPKLQALKNKPLQPQQQILHPQPTLILDSTKNQRKWQVQKWLKETMLKHLKRTKSTAKRSTTLSQQAPTTMLLLNLIINKSHKNSNKSQHFQQRLLPWLNSKLLQISKPINKRLLQSHSSQRRKSRC